MAFKNIYLEEAMFITKKERKYLNSLPLEQWLPEFKKLKQKHKKEYDAFCSYSLK
jgi:hypothetical protein